MNYPPAYFNFSYYLIESVVITPQNDAARSEFNDKPIGEVDAPSDRMPVHVERRQRLTACYSLR